MACDWQDVKVPFLDLLQTTHGYLTQETKDTNLRRVTGLGLAAAGAQEAQSGGPYNLCNCQIETRYNLCNS
jgi:hypothetical protein